MAKRKKPSANPPPATPVAVQPPAKRPALLIASIVLFVLWFLFLLYTAIWG